MVNRSNKTNVSITFSATIAVGSQPSVQSPRGLKDEDDEGGFGALGTQEGATIMG